MYAVCISSSFQTQTMACRIRSRASSASGMRAIRSAMALSR
jgi:hypothetical protein